MMIKYFSRNYSVYFSYPLERFSLYVLLFVWVSKMELSWEDLTYSLYIPYWGLCWCPERFVHFVCHENHVTHLLWFFYICVHTVGAQHYQVPRVHTLLKQSWGEAWGPYLLYPVPLYRSLFLVDGGCGASKKWGGPGDHVHPQLWGHDRGDIPRP